MVYALLSLNALLMIILPILLGIWLARKYSVGWRLFFIGSAGFVVSQIGHIPFNRFVLDPFIPNLLEQGTTVGPVLIASLILGLSAGVFEEVTRYIFYHFMKNTRRWDQGLVFGAGWGAVESIILGVLVAVSIVNIYIYQSGLIETLVPADQLASNADAISAGAQQIEELVNSPPWMLLLGAVERVFALILHISLSILVLQAFVRKNIIWLFLAIGWHTLVNAVAVFGTLQEWDVLLIEVAIGVSAVISLYIIWRLRPTGDPSDADGRLQETSELTAAVEQA